MSHTQRRLVIWSPRVLVMVFAAFVSLFALDVFAEGYGFWETLVALVMHMVPTVIVLVPLIFAWRWPWIGGVLYLGLAAYYVVMTHGRFEWVTYAIMVAPLLLISILFWIQWGLRKRLA